MTIHFEHSVDVARPPEHTFAVLDDTALTPTWLDQCKRIEKVSSGPNAVGTRLRYSYEDGGRTSTLDGEITERTPNERLTFRYTDRMMDVVVDFRLAHAAEGARLTHAIDIAPKTLLARLLSPVIRRDLPRQIIPAMHKLKALVEG